MSNLSKVLGVILAQHQVTPAQFHRQTEELMSNPGSWRKFQEEVVARVEAFQARQASASGAGDATKTGK